MIRVTIAVPQAHISKANNLALCIGYTEADGATFGEARYQDAQGRQYAVASGLVQPAFVEDAAKPLVEPEYGADMAQANAAQALISIWDPENPVEASPDAISAVVGLEINEALAALNLSLIE